MNIKRFLPDTGISMKKCANFYTPGDAARISDKNKRMILRGYKITLILFLACLTQIIQMNIKGVEDPSDIILPLLVSPAMLIVIYKSRYSAIDRRIKRNKEAMSEDLPDMIDRVILLLNTGMFIEAAIIKIVGDYDNALENPPERKGLRACLKDTIKKSAETNSPLIHEMSEFAMRSGVRELIRFAAIIENNFNKGSDLAEKLEGEGALLLMSRRKMAEERARMIETKLSLPLMLLLLSLILITSAPMLLSI